MRAPAEEQDVAEPLRRLNVALPGVYAWIATVLEPALGRSASWPCRLAAGSAAAALFSGILLGRYRPAWARLLALHGFVGFSVLAWLFAKDIVGPERLDPVKGSLGALGWLLFAFGWGAPREPARVPEDDPRVVAGEPLEPRARPSPAVGLVFSLALAGAALPLSLAWRITRPSHALLGHAVALLSAVLVLSSGAGIASRLGQWTRAEPAPRRLGYAALPLTLAALALIVGLVAWFVGDPGVSS